MTIDSRTTTRPQAASRTDAWLILAVLLAFSIAAPLNQAKVPPILLLLMGALGISVAQAGLPMSVYAITGLILALPSGLILNRAGARLTGLLAGGSIVAGATLGALSTSLGGLLASRVIEGAGMSFMAVLAPAIIAQWFVARQRGTAMGIWSVWVPVGNATMLLLAPTLAQAAGWRAVWWLGAAYALLVTGLYLAFVKPPPGSSAAGVAAPRVTSAQVLRNHNIWLLAAAFGALNLATMGLGTYLPTFLAAEHGLPLAQAALLAGALALFVLFFFWSRAQVLGAG